MRARKETARHRENLAGRENGSPGGRTEKNPSGGRPEFQGNLNSRNPSQPAPTWPAPASKAALDALARALSRWPR